MRLEERAADVLVQAVGEKVGQIGQAGRDIVGLLRFLDGLDVQVHEPGHRVLVHVVHVAHVGHTEEEQRTVERHGSIFLARLVDHLFRLGRLLRLDLDLVRGDLGLRESVDQPFVVQDVAARLAEQSQDGRLDVLELRGHLGVRDDELVLERLKVRALLGDGDPEQLVLEAFLCDREVEQRYLDARLGRVVRVGQLGRQVELEVRVVRDGVVADLHHDVAALLESLLEKHRLERRVERREDVLHDERLAKAHRILNGAQELLVGGLADVDARLSLHVADPLVRLALRVNAQRPAEGGREDDAVLRREAVGRKPVHLPRAQLDRIGHHLDERSALRVGHLEVHHGGAPVRGAAVTVDGDEGAQVSHVAGGEAHVADEVRLRLRQLGHRLNPAYLFAAEPAEQTARAVVLDGGVRHLSRELLLLGDGRVEFGLKHRDLVGDRLERGAQLREVLGELAELFL